MSRAKKRKMGATKGANEMPILRPNAAGIDIGATEIYVAVPPDRDSEPVRGFPTFTEDLHRPADWLKTCGIETVAMESTVVYWIPLFQILEVRGFEVCLVNARYFQNVPGRRTDVSDCQWLRYLHSVGLLRPSFRPADQVCVLRSLTRHRDSLIQTAATHVLRMHKALRTFITLLLGCWRATQSAPPRPHPRFAQYPAQDRQKPAIAGLASFVGSVQITSTSPIISLSLNAEAFPAVSALPPGDLSSSTVLVSH